MGRVAVLKCLGCGALGWVLRRCFVVGESAKKKTYRRAFARLQVLLIYFFSLGLFRLRLPQERAIPPQNGGSVA